MPKSDTIDFFCQSCHCKLQVPAAMAGVSGPCPNCHSRITAPAKKPEQIAPSNTSSLPPKILPEHIPAVKIRAAAETIRRSVRLKHHGDESVSATELQFRQLSPETTSAEWEDDPLKTKKLTFLSFLVPSAFVAAAAAAVLFVLHLADMIDLLNYQNGFKQTTTVLENDATPSEKIIIPVTMLDSETEASAKASIPEPVINLATASDDIAASAEPLRNKQQEKTEPKIIAKAENNNRQSASNSKQSKSPDTKLQTAKINPVMANIMERGEFPELKLSPSAPKKRHIVSDGSTHPAPSLKPIVGYLARENLDNFLNTKNLQERLPFLLKDQRTEADLRDSNLARPFMPVKHVRLLETLSGPEINMVLHRFMLRFEDPSMPNKRLNMIVLLVERIGKHPPLIHAKAFIEHYDKALFRYAQQATPETATFHCIAEARTSEFASDLPAEVQTTVVPFTIKNHPYYPAKFHAYLSKSSPLMSQIGNDKSFPYTISKYAVISFKWNTTTETPYIELIDIIDSAGWGG
ncbi:MAG: hypothetical protein ACPIA7_01800 [Akkermansiaceae bacterium]